MMNIRERLQEIFRDVFDDASIVIHAGMTADDIEDWDSLSHVRLILAIENAFNLKFTVPEIMNLRNAGEIMLLLQKKLSG